jgi:hypothetical protein
VRALVFSACSWPSTRRAESLAPRSFNLRRVCESNIYNPIFEEISHQREGRGLTLAICPILRAYCRISRVAHDFADASPCH